MSTHTFHTCALHLWTFFFFFFNDTATTEIYTLSLHDALPIYRGDRRIAREQMHDRVREDHEDQPRNAEEHHVVEGCAPDRVLPALGLPGTQRLADHRRRGVREAPGRQ